MATSETGVHSIPQLRVKGKSIGPVLSFGENEPFNIYDAGDKLSARGWNLSTLQKPAAFHISKTLPWVKSDDSSKGNGSTEAIYGTAASVPDETITNDVAPGFLNLLYQA